ncbi:MAG: protein kinase [Pirellulaceae bacterium]|nr:protein kinase [Pirellulaceae bacterium]
MPGSPWEETFSLKRGPLLVLSQLCARFESEWHPESASGFDVYLNEVGEESRSSLFRNLLQIDIRRRLDSGQEPSAVEYEDRYPQYAEVIRQEFQASTQQQMSFLYDTVSRPPEARLPRRKLSVPSVVRLGDYALEHELGRGAMGVVFSARHIQHGTRVALKTLPTVGGNELHRFKQEFRSLADVNHPNLIGLHTLQADGGQWFFTMDLVDGEDFRSWVRPAGCLDPVRLEDALKQLAAGVTALHQNQILHRDLKPSNVMVTHDGRVLLLDFGLALDLDPAESATTEAEIAGTPPYMAPEQFRGHASPASDWYAVGVMLYEALSGTLPFIGSLRELAHAKVTSDPPSLADGTPPELARLCSRLLNRDPAVRPDGNGILAALSPDQAGLHSTAIPRLQSFRHTELVGRDRHVREVGEAIASFEREPRVTTISISGRSGEGKTVLADHFLDRMRGSPEYIVLGGRCYDRESVPFKALDKLVDALCTILKAMPDQRARELVTGDAAVLAELFPVLNRVPAIARLPGISLRDIELERVRRLAASALRGILTGLSRTAKLVCFIDDLQWGDSDSAALLLEVMSPPSAPPFLLVGTFRSDEMASSQFLQTWNAGKHQLGETVIQFDCRLEPLGVEECVELVIRIVGSESEAVRTRAREMAEETGGNPFLLSELASSYDPNEVFSGPMKLEEVFARKLTMLPVDARRLLEVVAVSGHAMSVDEASRAAGLDAVPLSTLSRMRTERLLRQVGSDESHSMDTYHDRIRETVLRDMDLETRKNWHVKLGEVIEKGFLAEVSVQQPNSEADAGEGISTNRRVYDLAYHFHEGTDPRAFTYQLQAGEAAIRAYALDDAVDYLKRAEQNMPDDASPSLRYRVWERLGDACARTKRYDESIKFYQTAFPFASGPIEKAAVHNGLAEAYSLTGHNNASVGSYDNALVELGYPRTKWIPRMLLEFMVCSGLNELYWLVQPHRNVDRRRRAEAVARTLLRLSHVLLQQEKIVQYTHICNWFLIFARRCGRADLIAFGFTKLGHNFALSSMQFASNRTFARAKRYVSKSGSETTRAETEGVLGMAIYNFGHLEESEDLLLRSMDVVKRQGESSLQTSIYHHLRHIYSVRGDSAREIVTANKELEFGNSDLIKKCWGHFGLADAQARMGLLAEANENSKLALDLAKQLGGPGSEQMAQNHHGFVLLQSSDYVGAIDILDKARRSMLKTGFVVDFVIRTYPLLIEALVGPNWNQVKFNKETRKARRLSRLASFFAWRFPNYRPHILRGIGRLAAASGRPKRARRYFEKSITHAIKLGARFDLARAQLDLSVVDVQRRDSLRNEAIAELKRINAVIPFAERWLLGDAPDPACVAPQHIANRTFT